jgi:hypothetical protein
MTDTTPAAGQAPASAMRLSASAKRWATLAEDERDYWRNRMAEMLEHSVNGTNVHMAGEPDGDYLLWAIDTAVRFNVQYGVLPETMAAPEWREWFVRGLSPEIGARAAWRLRPVVVLTKHGRLRCPVCGLKDAIVEVDIATRCNDIYVDEHGGELRLRVNVADTEFEHDRYACAGCDTTVQLPKRSVVVWP